MSGQVLGDLLQSIAIIGNSVAIIILAFAIGRRRHR